MGNTLAFGGIMVVLGTILAIAVVAAAIFFILMRSWTKVAKADEALVVSGGKKNKTGDSKLEVIVNGRAMVNPITKRYYPISLRSRKVALTVNAQALDGVTVSVKASALVKIDSKQEMVIRAAERFASQDRAIEDFTGEQLEGSLRGVISTLTVVDLMRERKKFSDQIADSIQGELADQGLHLDSFQITEITDANGYIDSLGKKEIEEKRKIAEIAESNANRAVNKETNANAEAGLVESTALKINQANANATTGQAEANAEQAKDLARAKARQAVLAQEAENKQAQLDAEIKKVADAERYKAETEADAKAYITKANAEAARAAAQSESESAAFIRKQKADAEAYALEASANARKKSAEAEAEAVRAQALAEADAIRAKGEASADALKAEAEALKENQGAILAKEIVGQLPVLMSEFAKGYAQIGKITYVGGSDGVSGVMNGQSAGALAGLFETVKDTTGVDIAGVIQARAEGTALGESMNAAQATASEK